MTGEPGRVPSGDGTLALVLHRPGGAGPCPCVVACHGLRASKDSDKYLLLGAELAEAGLALARFDFRGSGESSGVEADTSVATRVEDVRAVLRYLSADPRLSGRFGLLGSSMGGYIALFVASERGDGCPVVTWNAPADLRRLASAPDPAEVGLGETFVRELAAGHYLGAPRGVPCHLVVQAGADDVVPPSHGLALHARAAEPRGLLTIPGADHRLTNPAHRCEAVARSLAWFLRFLGAAD